ncbi:hypothetical protein QBC35DRAFT_456473 [Podospora australis]|uniref:Ankyrin repeat protein n=1 Tax=Podospora australis TaxID=1536484 RepID=A0AAN6WL37_9PEZI|nr:hypothetical protein QBC35DRAFT_456473 [Podospora australis]
MADREALDLTPTAVTAVTSTPLVLVFEEDAVVFFEDGELVAFFEAATDAALLKSVERGRLDLVEALVRHRACVDYQAGAPVHSAIRSNQPELLRIVLSGKPSAATLSFAVHEDMTRLTDILVVHKMLDDLLPSGLTGEPVNIMAVHALNDSKLKADAASRAALIRLLFEKGKADVNVGSGKPLTLAIAKEWPDIFSLLLAYQSSLGSLKTVIGAIMSVSDSKMRMQLCHLLKRATENRSIAEVKSLEVTAITCASHALRLDVLEHMSLFPLPKTTVIAGFVTATSTTKWLTSGGLEVVRLLLHLGASGTEVDKAFFQAANSYNRDAFDLLAAYIGPAGLCHALMAVIQASKTWLSPSNDRLWLVYHLLEWGAKKSQEANVAFLEALDAYLAEKASEALVETLLSVGGVDVNFQCGEPLKMTVRASNVTVLKMLTTRGATTESMIQAFYESVTFPLAEDKALALLDVVTSDKGPECAKSCKQAIPSLRSPIRECVAAHPQSAKLVKRLAGLGCDIDVKQPTSLYETLDLEDCNTLLWTLCPLEKNPAAVSTDVIAALVKAKERPSPVPRQALILAANYGKKEAVSLLLKAGGDPRVRDFDDNSALFYASRHGYLDIVKLLLKADFKPNDGSLHEAARMFRAGVVATLLKTRKTVQALDNGKLEPLKDRWKGMNVLFVSFENDTGDCITRALLDHIMYKDMDSEANVFEQVFPDNTGKPIKYFFSPSMYLRAHLLPQAQNDPDRSRYLEGLHTLVKSKQRIDRFYSDSPDHQPPGAIGMPEPILREVKKRQAEAEKKRKLELEHQAQLRREEEASQHKLRLKEEEFLQSQAHAEQKTYQTVHNTTLVHQTKIHQQAEIIFQQQHAQVSRNVIADQGRQQAFIAQQNQVQLTQTATARKPQATWEYQQKMAQQNQQVAQRNLVDQQRKDAQALAARRN